MEYLKKRKELLVLYCLLENTEKEQYIRVNDITRRDTIQYEATVLKKKAKYMIRNELK